MPANQTATSPAATAPTPATLGAEATPGAVNNIGTVTAPLPAVAPPVAPTMNVLRLRDAEGHLTRAGMEHAIRNKGSAMHNNVIHTSVDTLPSAAELAKGNPALEQQARDELLRARAILDEQIAKLPPAKK